MKFESFITITLPTFITCCLLIFTASHAQEVSPPHDVNDDHMINITAMDYAFEAPEEINSGWTTIEYTNEGTESHFLYIMRLPNGKTLDHYVNELYGPLNKALNAVRNGELDRQEASQGMDLPEWFSFELDRGGAGIIDPGVSIQVTVYLEPGKYVLDCYMKTASGEFHTMEGMVRELTATDTPSNATPPEADIDITMSDFEMDIEGELTPGNHTVAVHVEGFAHGVHVARLAPETKVEEIIEWMHWLKPGGLAIPTPAAFVGGMTRLPAGKTGYFTLDLEPARYLFVSQYTGAQGVWQEVIVE